MTGYRQSGVTKQEPGMGERIFFPSWYYCRKSATGMPSNVYERWCGEDKTFQEFWDLLDENGYSQFGYSEMEFRDNRSLLDYNLNYSTLPASEYDIDENKYSTDRIPKIQCIYWIDDKGTYIDLNRLNEELKTFEYYTEDEDTTNTSAVVTYKRPGVYTAMKGKGKVPPRVKSFMINEEGTNFYDMQALGPGNYYTCFDLMTSNPWYYQGSEQRIMVRTITTPRELPPVAVFEFISRSWKNGYIDGQYKQVYLHIICFCVDNIHEEVIL